MKTHRALRWLTYVVIGSCLFGTLSAAESNPPPPALLTISVLTNGQERITWSPYPAAEEFKIFSAPNLSSPFSEDTSGIISGYEWTAPISGLLGFHRLQVVPLSSNALLRATVLNRLTYGPTLEDIERIDALGPQAFISEQLAWELINEDLDTTPAIVNEPYPPPTQPLFTNWIRVAATNTATGTNNFFLYLSAAGKAYIDDVRLQVLVTNINCTTNIVDTNEVVTCTTNVEWSPNLLVNGDFEDPLTNGWTVASIYAGSVVTNSPTVDGLAASGTNCLLLVGTQGGSGGGSSLQQAFAPANAAGKRFALSYSYLPVVHYGTNVLTARVSGSSPIRSVNLPSAGPLPPTPPTPPAAVSPIYRKLTNATPPMTGYGMAPTNVSLSDLRAYHLLRAVQSKRQLYEILVQFFENHFSTEYQKTKDWFDNNYGNSITNDAKRQNLAVDLEWREHRKWRQALLNPNCTFYDLLKISVESPAMIIYLDTILSTRSAPNENYAREVLELHTMGADNGYVQQDIVELARVWTGWSVAKKDASVADNPFAAAVSDPTNSPGLFVLHFRPSNHTTNAAKRLFTNVVVDPRFGPPWGGQPYAITINTNAFPGTNGMAEGYLVISNLANLPQTMEFLSVKLCQVFVHEGFEFGIYDYTTNSSPEARLIRDCMVAWDTPAGDGRKGNIRKVLKAIFDSQLFRGHGASQQKVKTPLELAVSAIRALRSRTTDTNDWVSMTADTDGYGLSGPFSRMGGMNLFAKPEPDGWSEFARIWLNTANLCERMRFAQHLLMPTSSATKDDDYGAGGTRNVSDPVKLLKLNLPAQDWSNAAAVVDFFLGILYPGEGRANLDLDRTAAINFLNTNEAGGAALFSGLSNTSASYDGRVRGMVALLMCFPRFQEQ